MDKERIHDIIINNLPHGFSLVDKDGVIIEFNCAAEAITGYSKSEVIGKSHLEIFHGSSDTSMCPLMNYAFNWKKGIDSMESFIKRKSGEEINIAVTIFPIYDDDGAFMGGVELFRDISEQKKKERERKNILSMFAHDMKNPVVIAGGFLARLLSNKAGEITDKQREYYELIEDELQRLHSLISDFLQFSRFEAKQYVPALSHFDLAREICEYIDSCKIETDRKNIAVILDIPESTPLDITADNSMIRSVISNLVENAVKYTASGGKISIAVADEGSRLRVSVSDTGIGISQEHLPFIFDAFYRVSKDTKGSGLGLFIAKTIVEAHGGTMWVESVQRKGSTFHFTLPKKADLKM